MTELIDKNLLGGAPADVTKTGPRPEQKAAPFALVVGSPNLLTKEMDDGELACTVTYQARRAASTKIEDELDALVERIDAGFFTPSDAWQDNSHVD